MITVYQLCFLQRPPTPHWRWLSSLGLSAYIPTGVQGIQSSLIPHISFLLDLLLRVHQITVATLHSNHNSCCALSHVPQFMLYVVVYYICIMCICMMEVMFDVIIPLVSRCAMVGYAIYIAYQTRSQKGTTRNTHNRRI